MTNLEISAELSRWSRLCEAEWIAHLKLRLAIVSRVCWLQSKGVL